MDVANRDYHQLSQLEIRGAKRVSQHLSGPFVVSISGEAYDAQTESLNRKFQLEVFFANPRFADFGACAAMCCGDALPGPG
jgi:hypothetical protein